MEGFNLNNLTVVPRHFGILIVITVTMIGFSLFFCAERTGSSKDMEFNKDDSDNDHKQDIYMKK